jgi:hypothetical protein
MTPLTQFEGYYNVSADQSDWREDLIVWDIRHGSQTPIMTSPDIADLLKLDFNNAQYRKREAALSNQPEVKPNDMWGVLPLHTFDAAFVHGNLNLRAPVNLSCLFVLCWLTLEQARSTSPRPSMVCPKLWCAMWSQNRLFVSCRRKRHVTLENCVDLNHDL